MVLKLNDGTVLEHKIVPLRHHKLGLSYTASGYGKRLPTEYMVRYMNKWRRVYCCCFSNIGTMYIGELSEFLIVESY